MVEIIADKSITTRLKAMGLEPEWLNGGSLRKLNNNGDEAFVQFENRKTAASTYDCRLTMGDEVEAMHLDFSLRTLDNRKQILEFKKVQVVDNRDVEVTHSVDLFANHHVNRANAEKLLTAFEAFSNQREHSSLGYAFQSAGLSKAFEIDDAFKSMNSPIFKELAEEPRAIVHGNMLQADRLVRRTVAALRPGG